MKVLVVDDDRTTRFLLRRALLTEFGCTVTEASDGVEALEALAAARYQLVILDVQMPIMDGLETLRALRDAPDFRLLPVVMLTAERSEAIVQQIVALGVLDYMTKPLVPERIVQRLRRVVRWLQTEQDLSPERSSLDAHGLPENASLLIVDGSSDFRRFFADALGVRRTVRQAETGARGFRDCLDAKPGAVFIGSNLGVLNEALLVKKIRSTPSLRDTYLIAIVDKEEDATRRMAGYDGRVTRTFVPEAFLKQFETLSTSGAGPLRDLLAIHPGLRVTLISAAEQVFGMMLSTEVILRDAPPAAPGPRIGVVVSAEWSGTAIDLHGCCDLATGRHIAGNLVGVEPSMVADEDVDESVSEVLTVIAGRLQNTLAEKQLPMHFGVPAVSRIAGGGEAGGEGEIVLCFQSTARDVEFWLRFSARKAAPAVGPSPAERSTDTHEPATTAEAEPAA